MNIAVYPGSFNPIHIGHKAIIEYLIRDDRFDMIYIVVSPQNPLKDKVLMDNYIHRLNYVRDSMSKIDSNKIIVDDIESSLPIPNYTVNTLRALSTRQPNDKFTLVIGGDNLVNIKMWRDYRTILLDYGVIVYPRDNYDLIAQKKSLLQENKNYNIDIINAEKINISSTEIREKLSKSEDVKKYIL